MATDTWTHKVTITVNSRNWRAPAPLDADIDYKNDLNRGQGGDYVISVTIPESGAGTGPWNERYYVKSAPVIRGKLFISKNYDTRVIGRLTRPRYRFSYSDLPQEAKSACPQSKSFRSSYVSYWYFNTQCGTASIWEDVSDQIMDHEKKHQEGYNNCLQSATTSKFFTDLEKLTGSKSVINSELTDATGIWMVYYKKLSKAGSYAGQTRSMAPFFYHFKNWVYAIRIGGVHPSAPTTC